MLKWERVCLNADLGRAVAGRGTAAGLSSELNAVGYGGSRWGDGSEGSGGLPDGDVAALDTGAVHSPTSGPQSLSLSAECQAPFSHRTSVFRAVSSA